MIQKKYTMNERPYRIIESKESYTPEEMFYVYDLIDEIGARYNTINAIDYDPEILETTPVKNFRKEIFKPLKAYYSLPENIRVESEKNNLWRLALEELKKLEKRLLSRS